MCHVVCYVSFETIFIDHDKANIFKNNKVCNIIFNAVVLSYFTPPTNVAKIRLFIEPIFRKNTGSRKSR